jgi:N-acetylglutamate synthase-like GNAT family acetyltransferase
MRLERVEIRPFSYKDAYRFNEMFSTYFRDDFKIEISDAKMEVICSEIADRVTSENASMDMLLVDSDLAGFIYYQIDNPKSDWCEREGWGFIREIYIKNDLRGKGLGTKLVAHVENELYNKGARNIYLTSDEMGQFWNFCGYKKTEKLSDINHDPIYEK